jgi:hypothetical protein
MILCNTKHFENIIRLRETVFKFLTLEVYFPFCKAVYAGKGETISFNDLVNMPTGSLGNETALFLDQHALTPMAGYEAHDMKHTLLGYPATMMGEICMQYFEYGNGNRSLPVMTVMLFGTLFMPEKFQEYRRQYFRGRQAHRLSRIDLKRYATQPLNTLQHIWKLC